MIEMKMSSDMPFPTPRWVISSPSHMTNAVPAVMVSTMSDTRPGVYSGMREMPLVNCPVLNKNVNPVDWIKARMTVRYRVH